MLKQYLHDYYTRNCFNSDKIFTTDSKENNCNIIDIFHDYFMLDGDEIEKCLSNILNNSADRIIISNNPDELNIFVCELSKGKRNPDVIKNKLVHTCEHIVTVIGGSDFEIKNLKCCYIGQYEDVYKGVLKKKSPVMKIPNFDKYNVIVHRFNCGTSFNQLISLVN